MGLFTRKKSREFFSLGPTYDIETQNLTKSVVINPIVSLLSHSVGEIIGSTFITKDSETNALFTEKDRFWRKIRLREKISRLYSNQFLRGASYLYLVGPPADLTQKIDDKKISNVLSLSAGECIPQALYEANSLHENYGYPVQYTVTIARTFINLNRAKVDYSRIIPVFNDPQYPGVSKDLQIIEPLSIRYDEFMKIIASYAKRATLPQYLFSSDDFNKTDLRKTTERLGQEVEQNKPFIPLNLEKDEYVLEELKKTNPVFKEITENMKNVISLSAGVNIDSFLSDKLPESTIAYVNRKYEKIQSAVETMLSRVAGKEIFTELNMDIYQDSKSMAMTEQIRARSRAIRGAWFTVDEMRALDGLGSIVGGSELVNHYQSLPGEEIGVDSKNPQRIKRGTSRSDD